MTPFENTYQIVFVEFL